MPNEGHFCNSLASMYQKLTLPLITRQIHERSDIYEEDRRLIMAAPPASLREICIQASSRPDPATKHVQRDPAVVVSSGRDLACKSQASSKSGMSQTQRIGHTGSHQEKNQLKIQKDGFFVQRARRKQRTGTGPTLRS